MSEEGDTCSCKRQRWRVNTEIKVAGAEERKTGGRRGRRDRKVEGRRKMRDDDEVQNQRGFYMRFLCGRHDS